jgi:hypothetical protein
MLSCYTANLFAYLNADWDAAAMLGASIRLAVREEGDGLAYSHHAPPLDRLPDGSRLAYAGAGSGDAALPELAAELERHGRVLVVADAARLPWSASFGGRSAPHWLLIDGRRRPGQWHAVDEFAAWLPDGREQRPHRGWLATGPLLSAMTVPASWSTAQRRRNALAFGATVPVPETGVLWLGRGPGMSAAAVGDDWTVGDGNVLPLLARRLAVSVAEHLDDLWAAAGHRCFAYRWRLAHVRDEGARKMLRHAMQQWARLPQVLRIAAESAARGRPRPGLVRAAFAALADAEAALPAAAAGRPHLPAGAAG